MQRIVRFLFVCLGFFKVLIDFVILIQNHYTITNKEYYSIKKMKPLYHQKLLLIWLIRFCLLLEDNSTLQNNMLLSRGWNKAGFGEIALKVWWRPTKCLDEGPKLPLKMLTHFNTYLMCKDIIKNQIWPWKKKWGPSPSIFVKCQNWIQKTNKQYPIWWR